MEAIQNLNNFSQKYFLLIVCVIVAVSFFFLTPKLASRVFSYKRAELLNSFIDEVKTTHRIDPQKYWQFREFYSPGYFTFNRTGIEKGSADAVLRSAKIAIEDASALPFLRFTSPFLNSIDYLTNKSRLEDATQIIAKYTVLYQAKNLIYYRLDRTHTVLMFVLPENEMQKANGFFDYGEKDKNLVAGKHWLNVTVLGTN